LTEADAVDAGRAKGGDKNNGNGEDVDGVEEEVGVDVEGVKAVTVLDDPESWVDLL
jgi:hypothetical protein